MNCATLSNNKYTQKSISIESVVNCTTDGVAGEEHTELQIYHFVGNKGWILYYSTICVERCKITDNILNNKIKRIII